MLCNIIPDKILKRINDQKSIEASNRIRNLRRQNLFNIINKIIPIPLPHEEIRILFDAENSYNPSDDNIIQIDQLKYSHVPSSRQELQYFNKIYDFVYDEFDRKSYDNNNAVMKVYINVGDDYNNAFWNGNGFYFGNGDKEIFKTFMTQNICSHEAFHAVTEYSAGLIYEGQSGALNEHISDVFAVCLDQKIKRQTNSEASWIIGEGIFSSNINGKGLRSFKDEKAYDDILIGYDDQPKHMKDYQNLPITSDGDWGGVHTNSGIPNHAFYRFCLRSKMRSYRRPLSIWYGALMISNSYENFTSFALNTVKVANFWEKRHLKSAWNDVGITFK